MVIVEHQIRNRENQVEKISPSTEQNCGVGNRGQKSKPKRKL